MLAGKLQSTFLLLHTHQQELSTAESDRRADKRVARVKVPKLATFTIEEDSMCSWLFGWRCDFFLFFEQVSGRYHHEWGY
jgi:hypothetical protein